MQAVLSSLVMVVPALAQAQATEFRPLHLFGDHMVLPAETRVPIAGIGAVGSDVEVRGTWGGSGTTRVDGTGHWRCELATPARGGPFVVTMRCGGTEVTLRDVLVGDVWLASGQSNMVMPVGPGRGTDGVRDWQREVAAAEQPTLRVFTVDNVASASPQAEVEGSWQVCSPATAAGFSACAYFFGAELVQRGKGPIGLVVSAWGGTVCEAWTSATGLREFAEFHGAVAALQQAAPPDARDQQLAAFWEAVQRGPFGPAVEVQVPERWSKCDLRSFDGVAIYECTVQLPPTLRGAELSLELGALDDMDTVWWNELRIGGLEHAGDWHTTRKYAVPATGSDAVSARVRVRVVDTGGEGGWSAAAADVRVSAATDAAHTVPIAGTWQRRVGPALRELPPWPDADDEGPNRPTVLWNGMLAPLAPFPFAGVLWYQGESNRGRAEQYARLLPAMITDWRRAFGRELPFYLVQIAPFGYDNDEGDKAAHLREAQASALALPGTGMVVTLDCGDANDIHPIDKRPVGQRLARLALARHYGESVACEGPRCTGVAVHGAGGLRLSFEAGGRSLVLEPGGRGFEVAGEHGEFMPAVASIQGAHVDLLSPSIPRPLHVRYAWGAMPPWCLRDSEGLPAAPFRASLR